MDDKTLPYWADILSVISFVVTGYLAFSVRQLKKRYRFDETVKKPLKGLKNCSAELREYLLGDFASEEKNIRLQLSMISAHLKNICLKIDSKTQKIDLTFERLVIWIKLNTKLNANDVSRLNEKVDGLIVDIEHQIADNAWEIRNG